MYIYIYIFIYVVGHTAEPSLFIYLHTILDSSYTSILASCCVVPSWLGGTWGWRGKLFERLGCTSLAGWLAG